MDQLNDGAYCMIEVQLPNGGHHSILIDPSAEPGKQVFTDEWPFMRNWDVSRLIDYVSDRVVQDNWKVATHTIVVRPVKDRQGSDDAG